MSGMKHTSIHKDSEAFANWLCQLRRWVHQHAELGFKEVETSKFVQERLEELQVDDFYTAGGTGVVARIKGEDSGRPVVAIRADMDALPLKEETKHPFKSRNRGVMHACGHDGHTAMLLGAAALLKQRPKLPGDVLCIFQPSEESGQGANSLIDAGVIDGVDGIFFGHIDTHFDTGIITVDEGIICAYADPFLIHIKGRSGHAARPHEASDAVVAAASLVTIIQTLVSREVDPNHSAVVTVGSFQAGKVHNVIADEAVLEGTIRSTHPHTREVTMEGLKRIVHSLGAMYDVQSSLHFSEGLPAVINDAEASRLAKRAARKVTDEALVISQGDPSLGGEDFACYQKKISGCMVRFGGRTANAGVAHSSTYDFDEKVLPIGAEWLAAVAEVWHKHNS